MGTSSATEFQGQSATIMMPILSFIILIISNILIHLRESEMDTQPYIDPHKAKFMFTIYLADKQFFSDLFVHGKVQLSLTFGVPSSCKLQRAYR